MNFPLKPRDKEQQAEWADVDGQAACMPRYVAIAGAQKVNRIPLGGIKIKLAVTAWINAIGNSMLTHSPPTLGIGGKECGNCGKAQACSSNLHCSACKTAFYCSKTRQLVAWKKGHKRECKENELSLIQEIQKREAFATVCAPNKRQVMTTQDYTDMLLTPTTFWNNNGRTEENGIESLSNFELLEALAHLPRSDHENLVLVCKHWKEMVRDPAILEARKQTPLTNQSCLEQTIVMVGGCTESDAGAHAECSALDARGKWLKMAPLLEKQSNNMAVFCAGEVYNSWRNSSSS